MNADVAVGTIEGILETAAISEAPSSAPIAVFVLQNVDQDTGITEDRSNANKLLAIGPSIGGVFALALAWFCIRKWHNDKEDNVDDYAQIGSTNADYVHTELTDGDMIQSRLANSFRHKISSDGDGNIESFLSESSAV